MPTAQEGRQSPVSIIADLMLRLHMLSLEGKGDSPEAAAACVAMEEPWDQLTSQEQERMRGLSQDLYVIEDRSAPQVLMTPEARQEWTGKAQSAFVAFLHGDCDKTLEFFRRAVPRELPPGVVPFLQGRCWRTLGELSVAIVFMKEAERRDGKYGVEVMNLLCEVRRWAEASEYANRMIDDPRSNPTTIYLAAGVLLEPTQRMTSAEARPLLERLVPILRRALHTERQLPRDRRELPRTDASLAAMLGLCLERLGRMQEAQAIYTDGLAQYPDDPELLTMRGIALYDSSRPEALEDLRKAAEAGTPSVWPYYLLAQNALMAERYHDCWNWCLQGLERPASREVHATLDEWLGICRFELGQSAAVVLESFDRALDRDPGNARILRNRTIAETHLMRRKVAPRDWNTAGKTLTGTGNRALYSTVWAQTKVLTSQRDSRFAGILAGTPS